MLTVNVAVLTSYKQKQFYYSDSSGFFAAESIKIKIIELSFVPSLMPVASCLGGLKR